MQYEVELKFRIEDFEVLEARLRALGAIEQSTVAHIDRYFNHPSRDFRATDEAFRIRSVGEENYLTYKGAVQGSVAKTRQEIEVGFAAGTESAERLFELVKMLGFRFVLEVRKTRRLLLLQRNDCHFELAIDDVPPLGRFLEIELLADDDGRIAAENNVWELASSLNLSVAEPRSYLDLLLTK
jgi:adenylate cyclase, class 2